MSPPWHWLGYRTDFHTRMPRSLFPLALKVSELAVAAWGVRSEGTFSNGAEVVQEQTKVRSTGFAEVVGAPG
jgi:hypothetical protein